MFDPTADGTDEADDLVVDEFRTAVEAATAKEGKKEKEVETQMTA